MHTTPTHILNPDPTSSHMHIHICSTLLAILQLVSCEHQFGIHYIEVFCGEAVCLFFCDNNISSDDQRHPCQDSVCHYLCLTLQRCSSPSSYLLFMLFFIYLISIHHNHRQPLPLLCLFQVAVIIHNRESSQELVIEECRAIIRFLLPPLIK